MLRNNVVHLIRYWGTSNQHVTEAEEELTQFERTSKMMEAAKHRWCKARNIDDKGVDFEDSERAEK